jgi:hypothetical protein
MPTPPRSATPPSPRGAFRVKESYPGVATFESLTCRGRLYETRSLPDRAAGDGEWIIGQMNANLGHDDVCPSDPEAHGDVCPLERLLAPLALVRGARSS